MTASVILTDAGRVDMLTTGGMLPEGHDYDLPGNFDFDRPWDWKDVDGVLVYEPV